MQKRETRNYDRSQTVEQEKGPTTTNNGQANSSKKSNKGSKPRRRGNARGSAARNRHGGTRRQVFKITEALSRETIAKLDKLKERNK